ncbi:MAG: chemotaxis protein MotB [Polaribacter sp.]|jgi:chemotaxis protein MotB
MKHILFFLSLCFILTSCLSKKKHLAEVQLLKRYSQDTLSTVSNNLKRQIRYARDTVSLLQLDLAERKGENNVLNTLRGELSTQIQRLELQIETQSNTSQNSQSNLNSTLTKRSAEVSALKLQLKQVEKVMDERQDAFKKLSVDLLFAFQEMPFSQFDAKTTDKGLIVSFPKAVFFKKGNTKKIQKKGLTLMETAATVFSRYPVMQISIIGHTNNNPTGRKSVNNNWTLSAMQAATIVHVFADEYDINTSQLTASGKGEFEPKASNETEEGKATNDRMEWIISQRDSDMERAIRKVLK